MRSAHLLLVALVILLVAAACGSEGLTDTERLWCSDNTGEVLAAFETLFGNDALSDEFIDAYVQLMTEQGDKAAWGLFEETYPSEYVRACQAAYQLGR